MKQEGEPKQAKFPRTIESADAFYRALREEWIDAYGTISSAAFSKASRTRQMSVDWAEKSTAEETYSRWEQWGEGRGVASITAMLCWEDNQRIEFSPNCTNPAHSDVSDRQYNSGRPHIGKNRIKENLADGAKLVIRSSYQSDE